MGAESMAPVKLGSGTRGRKQAPVFFPKLGHYLCRFWEVGGIPWSPRQKQVLQR